MAGQRQRTGFRAAVLAVVLLLLAASAAAYLEMWVSFAVALLVAGVALAFARRRWRASGDDAAAAVARALAALEEVAGGRQAHTKPLSAWVMAGAHVAQLSARLDVVTEADRRRLGDAVSRLVDATFAGPHGRRKVRYETVERMLEACGNAAPLLVSDAALRRGFETHLWISVPQSVPLAEAVVAMQGGLRPEERSKSFDPPVFKRRAQVLLR